MISFFLNNLFFVSQNVAPFDLVHQTFYKWWDGQKVLWRTLFRSKPNADNYWRSAVCLPLQGSKISIKIGILLTEFRPYEKSLWRKIPCSKCMLMPAMIGIPRLDSTCAWFFQKLFKIWKSGDDKIEKKFWLDRTPAVPEHPRMPSMSKSLL